MATKQSIWQGNKRNLNVFENGKVNKIARLKKFGVTLSCILRHHNVGFVTCNMPVT